MIKHGAWTFLLGGKRPLSRGRWPMWHIAFTREFCEDFEGHYEALIPPYMRFVYYDHDRAVAHWYHEWIAPFQRFHNWWIRHRYTLERILLERGIFYSPSYYVKDWYFNWDWRWYDKTTWRVLTNRV